MAIEAPISKFKKTNLKIYIAVCIGLVIWCLYDGYLNKDFIEKYTVDGKATGWLVVNRKAPPYVIGVAVLIGAYLFALRNKKLLADENELVISDKKRIPYDSIERIDKTHFDKKGFFVITYKDQGGREINCKLNNRTYDNLSPILDHLVAKIS
jgi:hypothetical protein